MLSRASSVCPPSLASLAAPAGTPTVPVVTPARCERSRFSTLLLGGLLLSVCLLAGCARQEESIPPGVAMEDRPDQETWDVTLTLSMEGRPRALVEAPYLARFERADSTFTRFGPATPDDTTRVEVQVYDAGQPTATVDANRLLYLDERRQFVAEGRVVVETQTGKTLRSETLTWDEADRRLRTDGFVRITTPTERLQGYRLIADENLETYTLARITGQVTVEE